MHGGGGGGGSDGAEGDGGGDDGGGGGDGGGHSAGVGADVNAGTLVLVSSASCTLPCRDGGDGEAGAGLTVKLLRTSCRPAVLASAVSSRARAAIGQHGVARRGVRVVGRLCSSSSTTATAWNSPLSFGTMDHRTYI